MKPHFHKVPVNLENSFGIRHDIQRCFPTTWHLHPELELHYVVKGEGVRFIGDNISNFSAGEILLLGQNLPHTWRCKEEYFHENSSLQVEAIVLHFLPTCLGCDFLNLPEAYLIPKLVEKAKKGMIITGKSKDKIARLLHAALKAKNLDRIILLLSIIKILAETKDFTYIASAHAFYKSNETEMLRLNNICAYTLANYKKNIPLEEIAAISNLSVTSFCRYFKLMTRKTYNDFLVEIRISHACRYLIEDKLPTEVICFQTGFNNVSNFYRHFKKITSKTPFEYKSMYLKNVD
ncbi:MAG TPA: AraC family transcriptional regulator [Chitinophagaceae bacterium]|jgi:AraC-like DNA-binding protein|nr:AraC family transcriptional regulator [Chitinophagaceae bacterium]